MQFRIFSVVIGMDKIRFLIPNMFTALSLLLGLAAIFIMTAGVVRPSLTVKMITESRSLVLTGAWLMLWCVLLDKLDGFAAKALNSTSEFGAQFDSMADLVSFGIAPAILVPAYAYVANPEWFASNMPVLVISAFLFALCAAIRLARFNAIDCAEMAFWFRGLPTTIAGAFVTLAVIIIAKYYDASSSSKVLYLIPTLQIACAILMVSTLYLSKLVKRKSRLINIYQIINIAIAYIFGFAMLFPEYLMFLVLLYLIVGFIYGLIRRDYINAECSQK
jgi:CDP-diacylglycerol--serine O-phosphatidyltransferase